MDCASGRKLDLDYRTGFGLRRGMDKDTKDLIARIGTRVGMLMEDQADLALTLGRLSEIELADAIGTLNRAVQRILALSAALRAMVN